MKPRNSPDKTNRVLSPSWDGYCPRDIDHEAPPPAVCSTAPAMPIPPVSDRGWLAYVLDGRPLMTDCVHQSGRCSPPRPLKVAILTGADVYRPCRHFPARARPRRRFVRGGRAALPLRALPSAFEHNGREVTGAEGSRCWAACG